LASLVMVGAAAELVPVAAEEATEETADSMEELAMASVPVAVTVEAAEDWAGLPVTMLELIISLPVIMLELEPPAIEVAEPTAEPAADVAAEMAELTWRLPSGEAATAEAPKARRAVFLMNMVIVG